ncbi:winged helix-turn-helix domain-containing protein [Nocardia altamirensis]|uniref:winged helix-turn-helix domain-containing protein n=1 Tax=Nocardia altamirensis TaxID=472158 RepID=UPI00114CB07E|nr:winged helix-turn-helix domain-containing protein [Nocardia altamirensis]
MSEFAEKLVFGGQFPRGDPEALRRLAATWREIATGAADVRASVASGIQHLAGAVDEGSHVGRAMHESAAALTTHSEQLSGFAVAVADWLDDVANDVELACTEMTLLVLMVLCAGTSVAAAAQARARFLALLEGLVGRIGAGSSAVTVARAGLFVAEGAAFGATQAGLNLGIQLAQPTRRGVDWALVGTAGLAGAGSAMGGRLGAGVVAKVVGANLSAGWGRAVVAAGAGVFGALGGAVAIGRLDSPVTQLISGGVLGLAAHTVSAARQAAPAVDVPTLDAPPTGADAKSVSAERLLIDGKSAAAERLLFSESVGDGEAVARLAQLAEQGAREQLMALSSGDGSSVELIGPAGPGKPPGGDGAFLSGPNGVAGQPESSGIFWLGGFDGGGGDGGYVPTRLPGDGGGVRPPGPQPGSGLPAESGGYSTTDRAGLHRMSVFGSAVRGGDGAGGAPASMGADLGLSSVWRDAGGAVSDGSVAKPEAQSAQVGVLERNPLREFDIRPDTEADLGAPPATPMRVEPPATPTRFELPGTPATVEPPATPTRVESPATPTRVEPPATPTTGAPPATPTTAPTTQQPPAAGQAGAGTGTSGWVPAIQPGSVAPNPNSPGAPDDPTLRPPELDETNRQPHVIARPGAVQSPADPHDPPRPAAPVSDVPPSMPDPVEPVQFRAVDESEPAGPAHENAGAATSADPGGSIAPGQGHSAAEQTGVPDAPRGGPSEPGHGYGVGGQTGAASADGTVEPSDDQRTAEQTEGQPATHDSTTEPTHDQDTEPTEVPVEAPFWMRAAEYAEATSKATADERFLDPMRLVFETADVRAAELPAQARVSVLGVESSTGAAGLWSPSVAVLAFGDVADADEVWGFVPDPVADWAALPAMVREAGDLYQRAARGGRKAAVVTVAAYDPSGGALDAARRPRIVAELVWQLLDASGGNAARPPEIHLVGGGAGAEVVRLAADVLDSDVASVFVKDVGALPLVSAIVRRGQVVAERGHADHLFERYAEHEQRLREAGSAYSRVLAGAADQDDQIADEYDARQVELAAALRELQIYDEYGVVDSRPLSADWHPEGCSTVDEVVDGLRDSRGIELEFDGGGRDLATAREVASAIRDHGAPSVLQRVNIDELSGTEGVAVSILHSTLIAQRSTVMLLNRAYVGDPDRLRAAWQALVEANPRLVVPDRPLYCLVVNELGNVLVQAGRWRAEKDLRGFLRELWIRTRTGAESFVDWTRKELSAGAFHSDGTLDIRGTLVASHFAVRIDRANASVAERAVHDRVKQMARVWTAQHPLRTPPANESERAQTLVNMALGEAMARAHGVALPGFEIPGLDSATVRELVTTVRTTLAEYPLITLVDIGFTPQGDMENGYAVRSWYGNTRRATSLRFNERIGISPEVNRTESQRATASGYLRGNADTPTTRTVLHELGHGLSHAGDCAVEPGVVNILYRHHLETGGTDAGYAAWVVRLFSKYGLRVNAFGEVDADDVEAPAESFLQVETYRRLPPGAAAEPTEGEWVLYHQLVDAAERAALEPGAPPRRNPPVMDPNVVSGAADRAREALARRLTEQRLALPETTRKAGDLEAADELRRQLELIERLAAARLRAALAHASADGPAEYDWAQALDILDQKLVALVAAASAVDAVAAPNPDAGNCAVSSLLALRDLFPDSDIRLLAEERRMAGTDLGKIIAAAGGAPEDLSRAELRARLLDPADPAEAALVLTQWKAPDDKGSQGHVELAVNQRDGEVAKEDGTVLSVNESRVREFSTDAPREVFQDLAILFDANGRPLRPLDAQEREQYATQLRIPFGHTPGGEWLETIAGLRELLRSWTDVGSAEKRADLEHWIDVLEAALRGATVLRDHSARQLVARGASAPIPGLFQGEPNLLELERLRQNARARLVELLPPGPVSAHLEALHAQSRRYSPEVNELYRHYRGIDTSLSLAETFGECASGLGDLKRLTQEIATVASDVRQQSDLVAQAENEIAERLSESRDPTPLVDRLNRLRDKQNRGFEDLHTRLQTQAEVIGGSVLTEAVAGLRADAGDELRSLRADLAEILAAGGFDGDIDKALSKDSRVRRYLARDLELATSAVINALAQAARIELLPTELTDPDRVADIADMVRELTANGHNEPLATAWGVFAQTFDELQVIAGCDRLRSRIQVIDTMERALLDARMAVTQMLDQPGPVLDDEAARYLRLLGLVYRVDRWATAVEDTASIPVLPGLAHGWVEQMSVKYALPPEQLQPGRDTQRRLLSKLQLTHDRLQAIIDTDPADLTAAQLQERTRPPDEPTDAAARVPYSADPFHAPTGFEWESLADQDADWLLFKDALVQEYLELRQYADWGRAAHQRRGDLTVLNAAVDNAVADAALDLAGPGHPPAYGPEDRARRDRLGASLFALRAELVAVAAGAVHRFSDAAPGTGIASITQLWPGSSAAWELEELSEDLRTQIAQRVSADPELVTWEWADEQLLDPSAAAQPDLREALEHYRGLELLLNLASDFHRAESWVRAIDAVDAGLVQARSWRDRDTGPGFGWDARLAELTDLAWHLDSMARTREELIAEGATRQEAWDELGDLDERLDVEFAKAGAWGAGANLQHIMMNAPQTCLVVMFNEAAQGNGPRPGFRIPENRIDEIVLSGVDGHDAALWANANWRRFRDVTAAFEWVSESPRSERAAPLRRTVVLALDYQPIDANAGANAVMIKVDDNGRVVAAEPELQHDDAGNPVVGVRHIEGDDAVRVWAAMLSADAAAAGVHALAFQGDLPVDPLHGAEPDNAGDRQIPRGRIHGPPPGPDPDANAAASSARVDAESRSGGPAVQVVRPRSVKKLTGVDLGIVLVDGIGPQERQSSAPESAVSLENSAPADVTTPDPALAAALAQRPQAEVIILSGDLGAVAERARAIRDYADGSGKQRERLVLVAIPEGTPTLAAALEASGAVASEERVAQALFEVVDEVVVVPDGAIADGVVQLSAMLGAAVTTATAAGFMAVLHNGGVVPGITGAVHDLRGRRVSVVAADIRADAAAPTGSRPETPWSTPDPTVAAGGTPWSPRTAPAPRSDPPTVSRPDRPGVLEIGGVRVELPADGVTGQRAGLVVVASGEISTLNETAIRLLARVMADAGRIVVWDILQNEILGAVGDAQYRVINNALHDLRKELGNTSIVTVSGFGVRFDGIADRIVVETNVLEAGPIRLERPGRRVFVRDQLVELGRLEFDLLEFALRNQGRVISSATMRRKLPEETMPGTRDLEETAIAVRGAFVQLRRKIPDLPPVMVVRELGCRFGSATGGVVLETTESGTRRVLVNGRSVPLDYADREWHSQPVFELLRVFLAHAGRIVSPEMIAAELYGGLAAEVTVRYIVAAARRRLGAERSIVTVPHFGWRFDGVGDRIVVDDGVIEVGGVRLEPPGRRVFVGDDLVSFGRLQFDLLELLMRNAGRNVERDKILAVWGRDDVSENKVTDELWILRRKLGDPGSIARVYRSGARFDGIGTPILVEEGALVVDEFRAEPPGRRVFRDGVLVYVSAVEFDVLALLMANAGVVVPVSAFLGDEWNLRTAQMVKAVIGRLRHRIGDTNPRARRITSIEGVGYRFEVGGAPTDPSIGDTDRTDPAH